MALQVGATFAELGARFDPEGFDRFERRLDKTRHEAGRPIKAKPDVDTRQAEAGLDRYSKRLEHADAGHRDLVRGSGRVRTAMGSLFIGGAGVAGATLAFGALAKGAFGAVAAFKESEVIGKRTNAVLESTHHAAGLTAQAIGDLATALSRKTGMDDEVIQSGENVLLTFTNIRNEVGKGNDIFNQTVAAATDVSAALGQDMQSSVVQLGKALNDPVKGVSALQRVGVSFTAQQKDQIKTLVAHGKTLDAQKLVLGELRKEFGGAAEASATWGDKLKVTLGNLQEAVGGAIAPAFDKAAKGLNTFVTGMTDGTGAGGKFADTARAVGEQVIGAARGILTAVEGAVAFLRGNRDAHRWFANMRDLALEVWDAVKQAARGIADAFRGVRPDLEIIVRAFLKLEAVVTTVFGRIIRRELPGVVAAIKGLAVIVRGVLDVIAGLLSGDFGRVWDGAKRIVAGFVEGIGGLLRAATAPVREFAAQAGRLLSAPFHTLERTASTVVDHVLGVLTGLMGAYSSTAAGLGKLPGPLGAPFRAAAKAIDAARDKLDDFRSSLRHADRETDGAGGSVDVYRGRVDRLRGRLATLAKGSDEYRATARRLREAQRDLNDAMRQADPAGRAGARGIGRLGTAADSVGDAVAEVAGDIASNVNRLAHELGARGVKFTPARTAAGRRRQSATFGSLSDARDANPLGFATGGIPHPGSGAADDHLLIAPDGTPVAALSGTEGILNRPQMGIVDFALRGMAELGALPRGLGGLAELWGSGMRHFAGGGAIEPVPGFPGERAAARVIPAIESIARRFHLTLTDAFGAGHKSPGHTRYGTAADFAGPDRNMDAAVRALVAQGYTVGYDGRFGSRAWPGHGPSYVAGANAHLHVELGGGGGGAAAFDTTLPGVTVNGPAGALRNVARGAASRLTGAGNAFLSRALGTVGTGPDAVGAGRYSKAQLRALWVRAGGAPSTANLMAAIALAESAGDPNAGHQHPYHGLWQVGPGGSFDPLTNARQAVGKLATQGLRAWQTFTEGTYKRFLAGGGALRPGARRYSGADARSFIGRAWDVARPYLDPRAGAPAPDVVFGPAGSRAHTTALGMRRVQWPVDGIDPLVAGSSIDPRTGAAVGLDSGRGDYFREALIHEFAHTAQDPRLSSPLAEGGASLFARRVAPIVYRAMGAAGYRNTRTESNYSGHVQQAKALGDAWLMYGQFGRHAPTHALGGSLAHFAGGGTLKRKSSSKTSSSSKHKRSKFPVALGGEAQETTGPGITSFHRLRAMATDTSGEYDAAMARAEDRQGDYAYWDRRYNLTDEELLNDDGTVNTAGVAERGRELGNLWRIRWDTITSLNRARVVARTTIATYRRLIARLEQARRTVTGNKTFVKKRRAYYDGRIATYRKRLNEWRGKYAEFPDTLRDAHLDADETLKEYNAVTGTQAKPADPADDTSSDTSSDAGDTSSGAIDDAAGALEPAAAPPSAADVAAAALAQVTAYQGARADLFSSMGAGNFMAPSAFNAGVYGEAEQGAGARYFGAGTPNGGDVVGAAGGITQNVYLTVNSERDAHTFTQAALHELQAAL